MPLFDLYYSFLQYFYKHIDHYPYGLISEVNLHSHNMAFLEN